MSRRGLVPAVVAARLLGVHPRTLRRWIAKDAIRGTRVAAYGAEDPRRRWFVDRVSLDAFLELRRAAADAQNVS